jgi:3,4-dihydroxy-2-butanone 4-phosphate synthase
MSAFREFILILYFFGQTFTTFFHPKHPILDFSVSIDASNTRFGISKNEKTLTVKLAFSISNLQRQLSRRKSYFTACR